MCGIAAIINNRKVFDYELIHKMIKTINYRGPSSVQYKYLPGCHLGHARLSIIDLKTGDQPMVDETGKIWVIFNGEIYNFRELKDELINLGYRFKTKSDTEVILVAYKAWKEDCLNHFRGMYAFLIWNSENQTVFAARDIFGEKPIYYARAIDGTLIFASEIKAILESGLIEPILDLTSVDAFLAFGYVPPNRTIYRNINTIPPGHYLEANENIEKLHQYWIPNLISKDISFEEASEKLRLLLRKAVQRQLVADVPIGAFLSGGIDSSTIVALMQRESVVPVQTFSVGFGNLINELPFARIVASQYKTDHHEINLETIPVRNILDKMATVYDEPFADSSAIPTYLISEFASKKVKVVLTGDGGDELFGGYWWYPLVAMSENVSGSRLKWLALRILSKMINHKVKALSFYSGALGMHVRWNDMWKRNYNAQVCFKTEERRVLWKGNYIGTHLYEPGEYYKPSDGVTGLNRGMHFDLTAYLPGDILVKVDRAAMANGLETRSPFLDRDLVEFALSLPEHLKIRDCEAKVLLKKTFKEYWPDQIFNREKQGFGAPYKPWLFLPEMKCLLDELFNKGSKLRTLLPGITDREKMSKTFKTWSLMSLGLWFEKHKVSI